MKKIWKGMAIPLGTVYTHAQGTPPSGEPQGE